MSAVARCSRRGREGASQAGGPLKPAFGLSGAFPRGLHARTSVIPFLDKTTP